jgi:2-polyprenyl-3-methyl-5-hydroxy-6-metoxy-1,4-benzoquinol methylase
MEKHFLTLQTSVAAEELQDRLRPWEPWAIRVDFSNGVSTKDFKRRTPFDEDPLIKLSVVERAFPFVEISGGRLLDIGCNAGYNCVHAAKKYGLSCTGIDVVPRHIEVSRILSETARINAEFFIESAETFSRPEKFDVALHFGTLYHLPNPVLSLRTTFEPPAGGYLALETQVYDHPEDANICYFMHMQNNDETNFWALSSSVLTKCLELVGFRDMRELLRVVPKEGLAQHMARTILVAQKPERPSVRPYPLQHINEQDLF